MYTYRYGNGGRGETDIQKYRQTERETDRQTERHSDGETKLLENVKMFSCLHVNSLQRPHVYISLQKTIPAKRERI